MDLTRNVTNLAQARAELKECEAETVARQAELEASPEWAMLQAAKTQRATRQDWVGELETALRNLAILDYNVLGDKHPHEAITVKVLEVVECGDPEAIKAYAIAHNLPHLLKLDDGAIKKAAKANPIPGVTVKSEARATIASDLSAWLPEE